MRQKEIVPFKTKILFYLRQDVRDNVETMCMTS